LTRTVSLVEDAAGADDPGRADAGAVLSNATAQTIVLINNKGFTGRISLFGKSRLAIAAYQDIDGA
jgi:hypothetical protein